MLEHGYLVEHLAPLARDHELIFYDQRLCGRSAADVPEESVSLAAYVDDIEALRQGLGLERIHLLGHSWGGLLAMHYAIRYGEHLDSLILLDSMAASTELWKEEDNALGSRLTDELRAEGQRIRESEAFLQKTPAGIEAARRFSFKLQFHDPSRIDRLDLYVPDDYMARSSRFGRMQSDLADYDLHEDLRHVQVPTLVLYGATEPSASLGGAAIHAHLPRSQLVLIQEAGHFPFIEQPKAFRGAVESFLRAVER